MASPASDQHRAPHDGLAAWALVRARDLEIERLKTELAAATDVIALSRQQTRDASALAEKQSQDYRMLIETVTTGYSSASGIIHDAMLSQDSRPAPAKSLAEGSAAELQIVVDWSSVVFKNHSLRRLVQHFIGLPSLRLGETWSLLALQVRQGICRGCVLQNDRPLVSKLAKLEYLEASLFAWRAVQFAVTDPEHFLLVVRLTGIWSTRDTFRLGIAPQTLPLEGDEGRSVGFWLSPRSGRLFPGKDEGQRVPQLHCGHDGGFRNQVGVTRRKGRGKGEGQSPQAQRGVETGQGAGSIAINASLVAGSLWALEYKYGVLEFFFAESCTHPFVSLGPGEFASVRGTEGLRRLPRAEGGFRPSILCRCPGSGRASLEATYAASPPVGIATQCVAGRSFEEMPWLQRSSHYRAGEPNASVMRMHPQLLCPETSVFRLAHLSSFRMPIHVDNPFHFRLSVHVRGHWTATETFYLGIEPASKPPSWHLRLNIRTGQLMMGRGRLSADGGDDPPRRPSGNHVLPGLFCGPRRVDMPRGSRRNGLGRNGRGLSDGGIWGLSLWNGCVTFFFADEVQRLSLGEAHTLGAEDYDIRGDPSLAPSFPPSSVGYRPVIGFQPICPRYYMFHP